MPRANNRGLFTYRLADDSLRYGVRISRHGREYRWQGFTHVTEARTWYENRKRDIREGRPFPGREEGPVAPTLASIIATYLAQTANKKNHDGEVAYGAYWAAALGAQPVHSLTATMIDQARTALLTTGRRRPLSHSTVNRYISWLHHVLRLEVERGNLPSNPCAIFIRSPRTGGQKFTEPKPPEVEFTLEEEAALARELGPYADVPTVAILTGLRQEELFGLAKSDLFLAQGYGKLHAPKGGSPEVFLISRAAAGIFERLIQRAQGSPWVFPDPKDPAAHVRAKTWYYHTFKAAATRAGIELSRTKGKTFHTLRHTFASRLQQAGVEVKDIKDLGRWKSWKAMERYLKRDQTRLRGAIERIATGYKSEGTPPDET